MISDLTCSTTPLSLALAWVSSSPRLLVTHFHSLSSLRSEGQAGVSGSRDPPTSSL